MTFETRLRAASRANDGFSCDRPRFSKYGANRAERTASMARTPSISELPLTIESINELPATMEAMVANPMLIVRPENQGLRKLLCWKKQSAKHLLRRMR